MFARTFAGIVARFCEAKTGRAFKRASVVAETRERDGASSRNFLTKKYPCSATTLGERLFLRFLMHRLLPAPFAVLLKLDFTLNFFLVLA